MHACKRCHVLCGPLHHVDSVLACRQVTPDVITRVAGLVTGGTVAAVSVLGAAKFTTINRCHTNSPDLLCAA